ncbi:MAG TPA: hypothetical protein VG452_10740 [Egibacteraceae bacterium]|nr:hypothetical protein [Egibacteraceae bacterium]
MDDPCLAQFAELLGLMDAAGADVDDYGSIVSAGVQAADHAMLQGWVSGELWMRNGYQLLTAFWAFKNGLTAADEWVYVTNQDADDA